MEEVIKVLEEIRKKLANSFMCGTIISQKESEEVGNFLLTKCQDLLDYCSADNYLLKDLQDRAEKIKRNELAGYNKELATFICLKLLEREKFSQQGIIKDRELL
jgi:hypothetical protein